VIVQVRKTTVFHKMRRGFPCGASCGCKTAFELAERHLREAEESGLINSHFVFNGGDDLEPLIVHEKDDSNHAVHKPAFDTFQEAMWIRR